MECLIEHPPSVLAFGCSVLAALCRQGLLQGTRAEHESEGHGLENQKNQFTLEIASRPCLRRTAWSPIRFVLSPFARISQMRQLAASPD
jgi:hypothetical protein